MAQRGTERAVIGITLLALGLVLLSSGVAVPAGADAPRIRLISVSSEGVPGDSYSIEPSMTPDGRYIVFRSQATTLGVPASEELADHLYVRDRRTSTTQVLRGNAVGEPGRPMTGTNPTISADGRWVAFWSDESLTRGDTNGVSDVLVADRLTGSLEVASRTDGRSVSEPSGGWGPLAISGDGRYVGFATYDPMVRADTNGDSDVYVRDRATHTTKRVSVSSRGRQSDSYSDQPSMSGDGRFIAFYTSASNLVPDDLGPYPANVLVRDLRTGRTTLASASAIGGEPGGGFPSISTNGRYVAFHSGVSTLVSGDTNATTDVFVRDRLRGTTRRVSVSSTGAQLTHASFNPAISGDGRHVAFTYETVPPPFDRELAYVDVYVHDLATGVTNVIQSSSGYDLETDVPYLAISAHARHVIFHTTANLPGEDENNYWEDLFAWDR
jgi:Tol biopolymer transport system component